MDKKRFIRDKFIKLRKKKYFQIKKSFFAPLVNLIKKKIKEKKLKIALYYPISCEINILNILEVEYFKKFTFLLPVVEKNNSMNFYKWKKNDVLLLNKYGTPEPFKLKRIVPDLIMVPILAFDSKKNRLGYGKGFYDKYLNRYLKMNKKILSVGVAFSFQKYHNLPINSFDYKLDYLITEKGFVK